MKEAGRGYITIEKDPQYIDIINERLNHDNNS